MSMLESVGINYQCTPEQSLDRVGRFSGSTLIIDLDETLLLRNSTEAFLAQAKPAWLAFLLLKVLDVIKPWKWFGGHAVRDVWRMQLIMSLFPWLLPQWRKQVSAVARQWTNHPLLALLLRADVRPRVVIATMGFEPVVRPLLDAMGLEGVTLIAVANNPAAAKRAGKLVLVSAVLSAEQIRSSLVLTDSLDDLPLLQQCAEPMWVRWPESMYMAAFADRYFPGQYLAQIKRPGQRYFLRGVLQEDFVLWILASVSLAMSPWTHVAGLGLLLVSFWCIYEYGYVDNDHVAERHETKPHLSNEYRSHHMQVPLWQASVWALLFAACGLRVLLGNWAIGAELLIWVAVLALLLLWYLLYDRLDKQTRVWLFPGLQFARSAAFAALVPVHVVGALAIAAHVLSRWVPYVIYRTGDQSAWPEINAQLLRVLFFVVLCLCLALTSDRDLLMSWITPAVLLWSGWRARKEIRQVVISARRLDESHE